MVAALSFEKNMVGLLHFNKQEQEYCHTVHFLPSRIWQKQVSMGKRQAFNPK